MPELILRFNRVAVDAEENTPIPFQVFFDGQTSDLAAFDNPLTDKALAEIRWYLENYWAWPSDIDNQRAREAEGNLPKWGRMLFDAIFEKSTQAGRLFERFDNKRADSNALVIDTAEPRILRLPWELLSDKSGYLFSKRPQVTVIRRMQTLVSNKSIEFELPVRILMVTCRPNGAGFIDPRSIATPLLEALDALPEHFEVEFLRPPTLSALDARLRDEKQPRVHIVHFDGHGVYDRGIGLGFLLFEDETHEKHLVDAEQLGTLLNESGIPLMVLNACQSAQPDDRNPFGSVASRLIESGVGGVVAMNYSVLVETAKRFTAEFYGSLARGLSANAAMDSARRHLFSDTKRFAFTRPNQEKAENLHLQDWFLPALYQQAETLTPFKPDGKTVSVVQRYAIPQQSKNERGGFPPAPLHGFKGRARELLDLERAFATRNIVVLHGFGGQGKTSLATQAADWFTRTHLFERAAFVSFETGASLEFVLNELGNALVEENFQIYQGDKSAAITKSLREKSTLVVFDNFESALPGGNTPMQELQDLLNAAARWFGDGHSRLLITTRNSDIPHPAFTPGKACLHKELEGLDPFDALELAASILEAYSLPRPSRIPLENLLTFLKGHPLSLQLALPQLRDYGAEQLVEQYQSILPQMKKGAARERNESLEVSLRFSLDRLGADALNWLSHLWIFEGGAMESHLLVITEIPEEIWNDLKPQLTSTALIRIEEIPGVNFPFIHFHPTLAPYLKSIADSESQESLDSIVNRYWHGYYDLANSMYQADTQNPIQARSIVLHELPNLKRALQRTLAAGALDEAVTFADSLNRFLDYFGRWRERDEVAELVNREVGNRETTSDDSRITKPEFLLECGRGERLLQQGRASEAEQVFRALLSRLEGNAGYDTRYDQTLILRNIGLSLRARGRPSQSAEFYRRAIVLAEGLEQDKVVKRQTAACHVDLADVFRDSGQYTNARQEYEIGLKLVRENKDDNSEGVITHQLGTLAMKQGNLNEARKRYLEALSLFQRLGEDQSEAVIWHQLGRVAQEARDWDEAERCYKESVNLKEHLGDLASVARTSNQLGIVADDAGRPQEAERWYLRAIELKEKHSTPSDLASSLNNLASLYLFQNRLDEANVYARRALAIKETLDLSSEPWTTYNILAQIAEKREHMDEVREWRRKEQESFAAFAGSDTQMQKQMQVWQPRIDAIVSAVGGDNEARKAIEQLCDKLAETNDWKNISIVIRRILNGERGIELLESIDSTDAYIIRHLLIALGDETISNGQSPAADNQSQPQQGHGVTLPQLLELVERAAKGDKELGGQLFTAFQQMARDENLAMSTMGNVLLRVLVGEHNPNLDGLPDEIASAIRGMLGRLKNK